MGKTALIVDDSRTARVVLQKMLQTHDLEVDTAESAEDALTYLSDHQPDIIFMDHQMPGMDGFEAVSAIKNNPATATIPIMMYTAQKGEVYVGQARALGAVGVLPKQLEPVEVSKVLETLRVIGGDAKRREYVEKSATRDVSGDYPSLANFDQDLRLLIQELFDQQRAIMRRDLLDSHEKIAARVADEIRASDAEDGSDKLPKREIEWPGPMHVVLAVLTLVAVVFAGLYWQSEKSRQGVQQQNVTLQRALDNRQAMSLQDGLQFQQQLDDYRQALDSTQTIALDSLEWAANQSSRYSFDELPMGDYRLSVIAELSNHLMALDFQGVVRIESHVGNFCLSFAGPAGYVLAAADLPAFQCDRIGFEAGEAYELGLRQSVAFTNFIRLTGERTGRRIRYEIISAGNTNPLLDYPASAAGVSASVWNEIAASNNRVDISLYPSGQ